MHCTCHFSCHTFNLNDINMKMRLIEHLTIALYSIEILVIYQWKYTIFYYYLFFQMQWHAIALKWQTKIVKNKFQCNRTTKLKQKHSNHKRAKLSCIYTHQCIFFPQKFHICFCLRYSTHYWIFMCKNVI